VPIAPVGPAARLSQGTITAFAGREDKSPPQASCASCSRMAPLSTGLGTLWLVVMAGVKEWVVCICSLGLGRPGRSGRACSRDSRNAFDASLWGSVRQKRNARFWVFLARSTALDSSKHSSMEIEGTWSPFRYDGRGRR